MTVLEKFNHEGGTAILGWLGEHVLYARFEGDVSIEIARQFTRRLLTLVGDAVGIFYFNDSSGVSRYDLSASALIVDALSIKREHFKLIVALPWQAPIGDKARLLPDAIGCLEYVSSAEEFETRLQRAVGASLQQVTMLVGPGSGPTHGAVAPRAEGNRPPAAREGSYSYVFALDDFEEGQFTATRCTYLAARPRGAWVCVARNDEQALALARQAALLEWAQPSTRPPEDFSVRFLDETDRPPFKRRS